MSQNFDKLKAKLLELFMLDQPDLDFGIFRIMNSKRTEITQFLDSDLLPQVQQAFAEYASADKSHIEAELKEAIDQAKTLGVDPETAPAVKELRAKLSEAVDVTALENEVYSDLYNFFRRYYKDGDFLSLRRYKEGVYAIPYEGEEVKLHWANHDQYYIKTSEYLKDYAFRLPNGKRVHFKLAEADVEKDNIKAANNMERRFSFSQENPIVEENDELIIRFDYMPCDKKIKQKGLNNEAVEKILSAEGFDTWIVAISAKMPTEKNPDRTLLQKHLTDYTARNTFDYFIHKDLDSFLRRELDFYIKNEVMHLDDIENESAPKVEQYLSKIKVIRQIAHKLIAFLGQLENFQKKLWLKKKFVVETNYCITLDRIPEELYEKIAANDAQRVEWVKLFAIDEIENDLAGSVAYSEPLTVEFLKANPFLVFDTAFFDDEFKEKLISTIENIGEQTDGLLIHSENFQALKLLQWRYAGMIDCVYIDPPYNSKSTEILYKNSYKHSSWLSLLASRLELAKTLASHKCVYAVAIDENEQERLGLLIEDLFGAAFKCLVTVLHNPKGIQSSNFSNVSEYCYFVLPNNHEKHISLKKRESYSKANLNLRDKGGESLRQDGRTCFYPFIVEDGKIVDVGEVPNEDYHPESQTVQVNDNRFHVWPIDSKGIERKWRYSVNSVDKVMGILKAEGKSGSYEINIYKEHENYKTLWLDKKFNAGLYGTKPLNQMFPDNSFDFPKSIYLVSECCRAGLNENKEGMVFDFFAGSGTTGHAVINLNREDEGKRNYILAEMGQYFDTVLKPRIQKVIYSKEWKAGKPVDREGISHMFKYIRLESYEDCLNNLVLQRTSGQQALLESNPEFRESYMLGYMLDTEMAGSASLLNIDAFEDPFSYKLNISTGSVGETTPVNVDLIETFNYLLGLRVKHIDTIRDYKVVEGYNPKDEKVLIIWRNTSQKSNEDLEDFFTKQQYNTLDMEFDLIYVNGDNNLENIRKDEETWKVRLIEEEFQRLMFDVQDV